MADPTTPVRPVPQPVPKPKNKLQDLLPDGAGPLKAGGMYNAQGVYISDYTRKILTASGWKEGDPIPKNLAEKLAEIDAAQKAANQETTDAIAASAQDHFKLELPDSIDISEMPVRYQEELRQLFEDDRAAFAVEAVKQEAAAKIESQIPASATPEVQAALRDALQRQETPTQAPPPASETPDAGAQPQIEFCPRCNWDMKQKFDAEPTDHDKRVFLAALLGQKPYMQQIDILGGAMSVTFRSLTSTESDAVWARLRKDTAESKFVSEFDYFSTMQEYRMALGIVCLMANGKQVAVGVNFDLTLNLHDGDHEKAMDDIIAHMLKNTLPQEVLRRVVGQHFRMFQRVTETLEARAAEPDFWQGIESEA